MIAALRSFLLLAPALVAGLPGVAYGGVMLRQDAGIELPDTTAAKAWAGVGPDTIPAELPSAWRKLRAANAWKEAGTWRSWAQMLGSESAALAADTATNPERRAGLCLLARQQGRTEDAWRHFGALSASPTWAAALMPHLLPGVPEGVLAAPGGLPTRLEAGVVLRPLIPPLHMPQPPGGIVWRRATATGLLIGETRITLEITLESGGVEVILTHISGPATRVAVLLPPPEGFRMRVEYNNWMVQDEVGVPLMVELVPGEEGISLWGRFNPLGVPMPRGAVERLPAALALGGLWLQWTGPAPSEQTREELNAMAEVLGELLNVDSGLIGSGPKAAEQAMGVVVRIGAENRATRLSALVSAVERFLLSESRRGSAKRKADGQGD